MSAVRFRIGPHSLAAGERVFHRGRQAFGTVTGISGGLVLVAFAGSGEYGADPALLRRDGAEQAEQFAERLGTVDAGLRKWALELWGGGLPLNGLRRVLNEAAAL